MTAIHRDSPYHRILLEYAEAKLELSKIAKDPEVYERALDLVRKMRELETAVSPVIEFGLTEGQVELLQKLAEGKKIKDASLELHIALETARSRLWSARQKMKARNVMHAVAIAATRGIIKAP